MEWVHFRLPPGVLYDSIRSYRLGYFTFRSFQSHAERDHWLALEFERTIVIRRRKGPLSVWCAGCNVDVVMLTPDEATVLTSITTRALFRLVDEGRVHFSETNEGLVWICLPTLLGAIRSRSEQ